ncbi:hypothetical protein D3C78_1707880 [compost metagenome]
MVHLERYLHFFDIADKTTVVLRFHFQDQQEQHRIEKMHDKEVKPYFQFLQHSRQTQ